VLPRIVLAQSFFLILVFVYGFIIYTGYLSLTDSRMLPTYEFMGWSNYPKLFGLRHWKIAVNNLAIFGILYILICTIIGLLLAILLDQKIRAEGFLRPIFLYPMALSFIVTGTAWKWFLDPGIGLESIMHQWGWESFHFDWIKNRTFAIYTVVMAAVWQSSGFVMAMFLAGLRGIDGEIMKAAQIDGASGFRIYRRIIIPMLRPAFSSPLVTSAWFLSSIHSYAKFQPTKFPREQLLGALGSTLAWLRSTSQTPIFSCYYYYYYYFSSSIQSIRL
jgi:glucose/mannose transport system permease protein